MGFGEVCVKKPVCGCFSLKGSAPADENAVHIRIAPSEACVHTERNFCRVWLHERSAREGKGHLKFTFSFQSHAHTMPLSIRILKIIPIAERRPPSQDSIDCRILVSHRDFRTLQEINDSFVNKVEKLLCDVEQHDAFASRTDLIKQKLNNHALAIFPDSEGFVLFREHQGLSRPEHVLLRIRPTAIELCLPQYRSPFPTFSSERHSVASLQEALMEFTRLPSWPVVRRGQFGIDWARDQLISQPRLETARVERRWEGDDAGLCDAESAFLDDTVQDFHTALNAEKEKRVLDATHWNMGSVKSLVQDATCISLHENVSLYLAIEKATLAILSHCNAAAETFVESAAIMIRTHGSKSLGIYKLLAAAVDLPDIKKAMLRLDLLSLLQEQYELMTQIFACSSSSESNECQCSVRDEHLEVNKMQYFTHPQTVDSDQSEITERRLSGQTAALTESVHSTAQSLQHQTIRTASNETALASQATSLPDSHHIHSSVACQTTTSSAKDEAKHVPKLTFYWLSQHDRLRSTNSETTRTSISFPDGRSIVLDEDLRTNEVVQILPKGIHPKESVSLLRSQNSSKSSSSGWLSFPSVIESTLHAWGVRLDESALEDPDVPVSFAIKCTILEIMCAFSRLNLESDICKDCSDTLVCKAPNDMMYPHSEMQHLASLVVHELLAPRWQVFPGEQPSIRWGPLERGTHVALALMHEFACLPLNEDKSSESDLPKNMRLLIPQDLHTESYLVLLTEAKTRLEQILHFSRIDTYALEEATSVINVLGDFVTSSPSSSPAQLVAYTCWNTFLPLEATIFKAYEVSKWPVPIFRLFHALLRLFKCMLERSSDVVLEEFLISSLLKRESWTKMVRDYSRAVLFSEKLERKYDPDELHCLRYELWDYYTAVVAVVRAQRKGAGLEYDNLPRDFNDVRPPVFGQDPLDFLRYLVVPEEGHAPHVLQRRYWGQAHPKDSLKGGIHEHVLLFLKTLFSIPNNGFLKERDISNYYLEFHWNGFKQSYMAAALDRNPASVVACRLHLEVIRMIMGHHYVEIFSQAVRLGIMNCLADEIALETYRSSTLGAPKAPNSQLSQMMSEAPDILMHVPIGEDALPCVAEFWKQGENALSSADADSGLLSSIEFASEGLTTTTSQPGSPAVKSNATIQDFGENEFLASVSFGLRESPRTEYPDCHPTQESIKSAPTPSKDELQEAGGQKRSNASRQSLRSGEIPSKIPVCRSRRSMSKAEGELRRPAACVSLNRRAEALNTTGSLVFPAFETRIPCPPPARSNMSFDSLALDSMQSREEPSRMSGSFRALSTLFSRKSSGSPRPDRQRRRRQTSLSEHVRSAREKISSKLKQASYKTTLPGLSPPAKLTSVKKISPKRSMASGQKAFDREIKRALRKKSSCGIQATISYSPTRLHVAGLSIESGSHSTGDALKLRSPEQPPLAKEKTRNVPLLNLKDLNSPKIAPGIGQNLVHVMGRVSVTSKKAISRKLDDEDHEPEGSPSRKFNSETKTPVPITSQVASYPGCISSDTASKSQSLDDCDWQAPPTFGIYCEHRVDKRATAACAGDPDNSPHECPVVLESQAPSSAQSPTALRSSSVIEAASSTDSHYTSRFETPSDFEYTGDVADDCRRLEMLEREFYGLSSTDTSTAMDCSMNEQPTRPHAIRTLRVPSLRIRDQSQTNEPAVHVGDVYLHSVDNVASPQMQAHSAESGTSQGLGTVFTDPRLQRVRLPSESTHLQVPPLRALTAEASKNFWERDSPALSGFKTPSDFEYTGDVEEDVKKLERLERMHHGIPTPSSPNSELDDAASTLDSQFSPRSSVCEPLPVPKLNLNDAQTAGSTKGVRGLGTLFLGERENSAGHSQGDALSSFSWMNLSANESVSESEFSALLEGTAKINETPVALNPYDVAKAERYVYSDVELRCIWVEVLLEGMLLEYNTRPARDHDTYLPDIEKVIKYLPRVLMHHLDDKISDPVVARLNKKLSVHSPNTHRLLRLLSGSIFSSELYSKKDHIARGTFAHVFRCSLPLEDGPEACILKVIDHPVEQNEMSTLMDTYSEISILEQFRGNSHVCHLYDYGASSGSIFMVMRNYKCSLLEWRQRLPEQSPGALRLFLRIFQNIIDAVNVLHDQNVVHFDLKCSNILLEPLPGISEEHFWNPPTEEPPFRVVIADFGEARSYSNDWEARTVRNRGTEFNKSPEMLLIAKAQQTDGPEYDRRKRIGAGPPSDVWALGCLLFELFTGEFLQYDTDWFRFFLRVTTNTMPVIDSEKQRMLASVGHREVCDLLHFILVREHLWRPDLASIRQKSLPLRAIQKVPKRPVMSLLGTFHLPREKVVSFSPSLKLARLDCLHNPWILSENNISLVVCIKGSVQPSPSNLNSTASRANVEVLEVSLGEEEGVCHAHANVVARVGHSRCICFTSQDGFESDALELVLRTLRLLRPSSTDFGNLMDLRRSLKTF